MSIFLHGLAISNYRGISDELQKIGPFKKCNFFIGANNSGKSIALHFIRDYLCKIQKLGCMGSLPPLSFPPLEVHLGKVATQVRVGLGLPTSNFIENGISANRNTRGVSSAALKGLLSRLSENLDEDGMIWITSRDEGDLKGYFRKEISVIESNMLGQFVRVLGPDNSRSYTQEEAESLILDWAKLTFEIKIRAPKFIPAIRIAGQKGTSFSDFSGAGVIDKLAELQNPSPTERHLAEKFASINRLLQSVIGNDSAKIEIPHDRAEITVHMDGRVLPLSFLGTGIHEVILIATFCILTEDQIVCIEEPEIHLHPTLQKKLMHYLMNNTNNQYFIATHSASIIDTVDASVFHVTHQNGSTQISTAITSIERFSICRDLGYRASDLLQTNFIIWVEGPSDRIYLRHWISAYANELIEGIDYSIMFYGGRLLSHLSSDDDVIEDFINLRKLNQNMAILIDSDKDSPDAALNKTKLRIVKSFNEHGDLAWVTAWREVENYLTEKILTAVMREKYSDFEAAFSSEQYSHRLPYKRKNSLTVNENIDKVGIARLVSKLDADLSHLDLERNIKALTAKIQASID